MAFEVYICCWHIYSYCYVINLKYNNSSLAITIYSLPVHNCESSMNIHMCATIQWLVYILSMTEAWLVHMIWSFHWAFNLYNIICICYYILNCPSYSYIQFRVPTDQRNQGKFDNFFQSGKYGKNRGFRHNQGESLPIREFFPACQNCFY